MQPKDLHMVWSAPDNTRLTAKQFSFRLPVHVAAKLAAIGEMYPGKSRTQIVGDLLATAIDQWASELPSEKGAQTGVMHPPNETPFKVFEEVGPIFRYQALTNKHFVELERGLGNESAERFFKAELVVCEELTSEEREEERFRPWGEER